MSKSKVSLGLALLAVLAVGAGMGCDSPTECKGDPDKGGTTSAHAPKPSAPSSPETPAPSAQWKGKKVLLVDSYHAELAWSASVIRGAASVLDDTGVNLKIISMDTKRNPSEEFKQQAALQAKAVIEEFRPDIVIVADDNAAKYLVVPYYKDKDLPFVFCGVNWDASIYGFPCQNVTGMVEVALTQDLLRLLADYAKGDRVGFLGPDVLTRRKDVENIEKKFGVKFAETAFVKDLAEWKDAFKRLQTSVDVLLLAQTGGVEGWDEEDAKAFVLEHTRIPTGADEESMAPFALVGLTKVGEEQGEWAARAALRILDGTPPASIPVPTNERGRLFINMKIAERMKTVFKTELLEQATILR